jgi:preprotein translocase subunit SecA
LNEIQKEDEDYIVSKAGLSNSVVVATNTAGRGTDIILSPEAKKDGGLHVIFAFYPANSRVEDQGLGRAGRQGQMGSCEVIIH